MTTSAPIKHNPKWANKKGGRRRRRSRSGIWDDPRRGGGRRGGRRAGKLTVIERAAGRRRSDAGGRWPGEGGGEGGLAGRLGCFAVRYAACRRRRISAKVVMAWWRRRVVFPVKRAWLAVSGRLKPQKDADGGGILKLHDDVQMCGYQDVQVMWEMLRRSSEMELLAKHHRKRPLWRLSAASWWTSSPRKATSSPTCGGGGGRGHIYHS